MSSRTTLHVAVLMGGPSREREVSLNSGQACSAALREAGYKVSEIDAGDDLVERLRTLGPDVVFNALHGRWGEDGCVQGILEWLQIPYTHSGVLASALAMDKQKAKDVFAAAELPVTQSVLAPREAIEAAHVMPVPYVIKPNNEGSSVGVYIVTEAANGPPALAAEMPDVLLVERYIQGRELTVTIMGDRPLAVTDIVTDSWYDYHAKYGEGGSHHVVPAMIPQEIEAALKAMAFRAHNVLGCRGVSRTDFRWDEELGLDGIVLLETNTQPGMTSTSLSPEQAQSVGITFPEFCAWMVEDASCNR